MREQKYSPRSSEKEVPRLRSVKVLLRSVKVLLGLQAWRGDHIRCLESALLREPSQWESPLRPSRTTSIRSSMAHLLMLWFRDGTYR